MASTSTLHAPFPSGRADAGGGLEASPFPAKRGEIGFVDDAQSGSGRVMVMEVDLSSGEMIMDDTRHPAEPPNALPRRSTASLGDAGSSTSSHTLTSVFHPPRSYCKTAVFRSLRSRLPNTGLGGVSNATFLRLWIIILCEVAVIVSWVFAFRSLKSSSANGNDPSPASSSDQSSSPDSSPADSSETNMTAPSLIFVHVAFSFAVLILLVFFERAIYQARVERFTFLHPGILPQYRYRGRFGALPSSSDARQGLPSYSIPYAPWNRPSLPSYAAALGVRGTGDVEDEIIAVPPPPAYGHTRGSTLLLTGLAALRDPSAPPSPSPSGQRISRGRSWRESIRSAMSARGLRRENSVPQPEATGSEHQVSTEASRALAVGDALAKLEEGSPKEEGLAS